jgi:hypothetical protein
MPNTFELIASSTVGSGGAANITFSSIPQTFTDLCLKVSTRDANANVTTYLTIGFNGSTANFSIRGLGGGGSGSGSSWTSPSNFLGDGVGANATASTFGSLDFYIPNYTGSSNKSWSADAVGENNATTAQRSMVAGLWSQTAAITSIILYPLTANFSQHSTAYLYGVKNA